jgi:hypothetical protein
VDEIKLWVDDIRPKPERFSHWAKNYQEAICILKTKNVIELSLDHDLGEEKTGYDIAKWIEKQAYCNQLGEIDCNCHSQNPTGRQNIMMALYNAAKYWTKP